MRICSKPTELCSPELLLLLCSVTEISGAEGRGEEENVKKEKGVTAPVTAGSPRHAVITSMVNKTKPEQKPPTLAVTLEKLETQFLY